MSESSGSGEYGPPTADQIVEPSPPLWKKSRSPSGHPSIHTVLQPSVYNIQAPVSGGPLYTIAKAGPAVLGIRFAWRPSDWICDATYCPIWNRWSSVRWTMFTTIGLPCHVQVPLYTAPEALRALKTMARPRV